jgi:adenylate cyclase
MAQIKKFKGIKFSISLTAAAVALVAVASGLVALSNYYQVTKFARVETERQMNEATDYIAEQIQAFIRPVLQSIDRLRREDPDLLYSDKENNRFVQVTVPTLNLNEHIRSVYIGYPNGDFSQVVSFTGKNEKNREIYKANEAAKFAYVTVRDIGSAGKVRTTRPLLDNGSPSQPEWVRTAQYDPRTRPWYGPASNSQELQRTEPYVFKTSRLPGITFSKATLGKAPGVIGVDLDLQTIQSFLQKLKVTPGSRVAIATPEGVIVAHSETTGVKIAEQSEGNDLLSLMTLKESGDVVLDTVLNESEAVSSIDHVIVDGEEYLFRNIPLKLGTTGRGNNRILLAVPWAEIAAAATTARNQSLLIALGLCAVVMLMALFFARRLAKPIEALTEEAKKISRLDLKDDMDLNSRISEIHDLMVATKTMKSVLGVFGKFVPKTLVRQLLQSGSGGELGGKRRDMVIMFCDIKDFTSIAEAAASEDLMRQLSDYLESQSNAILEHAGTIDKYIGDSIMAFWNAPIEDPEMEKNACLAVLAARTRLRKQNEIWGSASEPVFITRYGLHKGNVIVGNVGSTERLNYTVMGSEVNLASRLEGLNKAFGTEILASSTIQEAVSDLFLWRPVGRVAPKGVSMPVEVYELLGLVHSESAENIDALGPDDQEIVSSWKKPFSFVSAGDWFSALPALEEFLLKWPDDGVALYYRDRANFHVQNPDAAHEDAEFFDSK